MGGISLMIQLRMLALQWSSIGKLKGSLKKMTGNMPILTTMRVTLIVTQSNCFSQH